jgi:hypothetical protein
MKDCGMCSLSPADTEVFIRTMRLSVINEVERWLEKWFEHDWKSQADVSEALKVLKENQDQKEQE